MSIKEDVSWNRSGDQGNKPLAWLKASKPSLCTPCIQNFMHFVKVLTAPCSGTVEHECRLAAQGYNCIKLNSCEQCESEIVFTFAPKLEVSNCCQSVQNQYNVFTVWANHCQLQLSDRIVSNWKWGFGSIWTLHCCPYDVCCPWEIVLVSTDLSAFLFMLCLFLLEWLLCSDALFIQLANTWNRCAYYERQEIAPEKTYPELTTRLHFNQEDTQQLPPCSQKMNSAHQTIWIVHTKSFEAWIGWLRER